MDIKGKIALVTGAAGGIGRTTALALATKGASSVVIADVDAQGLDETAALVGEHGTSALAVPTDVTSIESMAALFATVESEAGGLDILYNNAGLATGVPQFPEMQIERVAALCDVNLKGVMLGTRLGIDLITKRGGGVIVNTSSIAAHHTSGAEAIYNTTKAAIVFFTNCCAEFKDTHNIRFNCVCPGVTDTPMLARTGDGTNPAEWLEPILSMIELLPAERIADVVIGFIEDDTKNGECVTVENTLVEQPS